MSLRRSTLIYFILATLGLLSVSLLSLNRILKPHFLKQQKAEISINLQRAEEAIAQRQEYLSAVCADLAALPEFVGTSQDLAEQFSINFISAPLANELNLYFVLLIDPQGNPLFSQKYAFTNSDWQSIPEEISLHLIPDDPILASRVDSNPGAGLLEIDGLPVLIVSRPVINPSSPGQFQGTLIVGSLLDQSLIDRLDDMLQLVISIFPLQQTSSQPELAVAAQQVQSNVGPYIFLSDNLITGYDLLDNFYSEPAFLIKIEQYPGIYKNGELIFNYIILALIMSGITFITILFLLIEGNVLNRLRQLSADVAAVGRSGDIKRRLTVKRKDELGQLGQAINGMLSALQQAVFQRQESEERFQKLVESMDDIVFSIDRENDNVQVYGKNSSKSTQMREGTLYQKLNVLINELGDQVENRKDLLEKTYAGEISGLEWTTREHGQERSYFATLSPMHNPQGETTAIVGVSRDVTDIKKLERDLRQQADEFGALYETSQLLLSQMDIEATQESICYLAVQKMGMDSAWIGRINHDGSQLMPVASHGLFEIDLENLPLYDETGPNSNPAVKSFVGNDICVDNRRLLHGANKEDTLIPVSMVSIPLTQGNTIIAIMTLIKHKPGYFSEDHLKLIKAFANLSGLAMQNTYLFKQVLNGRERLQTVSRRLVEIQEEERRTIALELHDEIGQILTGLRLSVDMINTLPKKEIPEHTSTVIAIINDLISRVRQLSLDLRPSMLDDLGIVPTIIWHIDRYSSQTGIQVNLHQTNVQNRRFRSDIETTIYRVVQEALTNIARHANVKTANIRLWCTDKILGVQIEDEGKGFDPDEAFSAYKSRGLLGMRERVGFIGGQLLIVSQPDHGTSLTIEVPLEGKLERRQHDR